MLAVEKYVQSELKMYGYTFMFSAIFTKGDNSPDFLFAFVDGFS